MESKNAKRISTNQSGPDERKGDEKASTGAEDRGREGEVILPIETSEREVAPAFQKAVVERIGDVVEGRISIGKALRGGDPLVRRQVEAFIDKYKFQDSDLVMEELRKARIMSGLLSENPAESLSSAKLAQKEKELQLANNDQRGSKLSPEMQKMADQIKEEKRAKAEEDRQRVRDEET